MIDANKRIAILTHTAPPDSNGQAVVLGRVLADLQPDSYCIVSGSHSTATSLPGRHARIPRGPRIPRIKFLKLLVDPLNLLISIWWWKRQLSRILKEQSCDAVVACTGDVHEFPAAYLAAKKMNLPLIAYVFDWYGFKYNLRGWHGGVIRRFAQTVEGPLLRRCAAVIAPNESLQDEYRQRYGVESTIVRNPTTFAATTREGDGLPPQDYRRQEVRICYTGAVYHAHFDACRNLLTAIDRIHTCRPRLEIFTDAPPASLEKFGIRGALEIHPRVSLSAVQAIQQGADILFLPLAFESPYPEIIKTSAPGKMGDYLASGRPILVHAPPDSFVAWYFRRHDCGVVVDRLDPDALAGALQRLLDDPDLRRRIAANALHRAAVDFGVKRARQAFREVVGLDACQVQCVETSDVPHAVCRAVA